MTTRKAATRERTESKTNGVVDSVELEICLSLPGLFRRALSVVLAYTLKLRSDSITVNHFRMVSLSWFFRVLSGKTRFCTVWLINLFNQLLANTVQMLKDGAYYCYCAYVLRISRYSDLLSPMLTNTGIFLRGLKLSGESRP